MAAINTTGDLRKFLCNSINAVANGTMDISKAKEVEIVFRPEAFKISKNSSKKDLYKIKSKIIAIKYIGKNSYLHLDILNKLVKKHIHIKVSGKFIPPKNKICYISIGKRDFFIFKYK